MHVRPPRHLSFALAPLAALALMSAPPATAQPARALTVPAGPLDAALTSLAAQTGQQLLYTPNLAQGRRTAGFSGRFTVEQALARLLGAEVEVSRAGANVLVLRPRAGRPGPVSAAADGDASRPFAAEAAGSSGPAAGATPPAAEPADQGAPATVVEAVEVTGSHIRGAGAGASPLVTLTAEGLLRAGHATVAEALSVLPQNYGGQNTEGTVATNADVQGANTNYATGVNLRGLGSNATLVLVNGRRLGGSGAAGDFADVSTLPTIAVSRVEVLLDGASAVYGSDAVAGVVNVILRRDLDGGEIRASAGTGAHGSPRDLQIGAVAGRTWAGGSLLLAWEGQQRGALAAADRPWTRSADLRPYGGADRRITTAFPGNIVAPNPATGANGPYYGIPAGQPGTALTPGAFLPGQVNRISRQQGLDILPAQRRQSLYAAVHQDLSDRLEVSADARYGFRAARTHIAGPVSTFSVGRNNPFFVSPNGAASNQVQYSFVGELPNPVIRATAESLSATLGARLRLSGDWALEGYGAFAQEINEARSGGVVNTAILAEALGNVADRPETAYSPRRDGYFNPYTGLAANPAAVMAAVGSGFTSSRTRTQVRSGNLQADGTLVTLPGGAVKLAVGVNAREETFRRQGASYTSTVAPSPQARVAGRRQVGAAFAEVRVPLVGPDNARPGVARLELSGAVRAERYSDFGNTLDPKAGIVWAPVDDLRLRATYGHSFRAPGLRQLLSEETISPIQFALGPTQVLTLSRQGGNPDLEPETARAFTAGFDYRPTWSPGTSLSVTAFDTDFRGRISQPVNENFAEALTDPRFVDFVQHLSPATNPADLAAINALLAHPNATASAGLNPPTSYVAIVDLRSVNTGELRVRGLDLQASHSLPLGGGTLSLGADATRLLDYQQRLTPTAARDEFLGQVTYPAKLRARLAADWSRGGLGAGVSLNHLSAFRDAADRRIDNQTTLDLRLRLAAAEGRLAGTTLGLTVRNLLNTAPPFYDNPFGYAYDPANADVVGRFVRIQLTRSW